MNWFRRLPWWLWPCGLVIVAASWFTGKSWLSANVQFTLLACAFFVAALAALNGRSDPWLQRWAAIATIVGLPTALIVGFLGYESLRTSLRGLEITEEQSRPHLKISGRVFIDRALRKPSFEVIIINLGPAVARDISLHLSAIFRNETKSKYLGTFPISADIEVQRPFRLAGATVEQTLIEWLRRAVNLYDPSQHGPSKLNYYLQYRDGTTGRLWGGLDDSGDPLPNTPHGDIDLTVER